MTKSISSALETHLASECTTVTTCWEITRKDGYVFRLTEHDNDIVISGDTYNANLGYQRTAFSQSADMDVDNVKVTSFFDSTVISREHIERGLFDGADVRVFLVNYLDTTQGILRLRRGTLGEVQSTELDIFTAELRGLAQKLQQNIGILTQSTCRASLGAAGQCRFPIQPDVVLRDTYYEVGDFVRVNTGNLAANVLDVPVLDADFEALTGWTTVAGDPDSISSVNDVSAYEGSNFLHGNTSASASGYEISQDVDITAISGYSQTDLDAGYYYFRGSIRMVKTTENTRDAGRIRVLALDSSNVILKEVWNSKYEVLRDEGDWTLLRTSDVLLPANTVTLRFYIEAGSYDAAGITNVGFDALTAEIVDNDGDTGSQEFYENRIYECTTAGTTAFAEPSPPYDTTIDADTIDGDAVFTARDAFMRHATVATVTDKRTFTVTITTPSASVDDYYNQGAVEWETGNNAERIMEVKDWDQATSQVTLFLEMPDTIQVGDKLRIFPGCDKTRDVCRDKFRIANSTNLSNGNVKNFDGEPDLPGPDHVLTYPDAK